MAEIFLGPLIEMLFDKLASGDLLNLARMERTHTLLKKLSMMLEQVQAVVADAEEKQNTNRSVTLWLSDLEDLSYDMDDVLDEFATEALRRKVMQEPGASTSKVRALIPDCCRNLVSDFRMRPQMDEITKRLQELFDLRVGLGLQNKAEGGPYKAPQSRITSSLPTEPCFHGRDKDKSEIMDSLLSDQSSSNKVGIVPIVGMGGVGKTTLAQMVYNDPVVDKHFEKKVWVCVSEEFSIMGVTKAILESVTSQTCETKELDYVQVQLKRALAGKKFLIVLDDVWNENYDELSKLKSPFGDGAPGSKVIVTTRNRDVALIMAETNKYHFLTELSEDDCWLVFAQHAFKDGSMDENPNLVSIGREIIKKCKGLPLAARTLGGLLRYKFMEDEWEGVLNSKIWELPEERSHILPALRLSYHHLPSHLKKCFAYCSIFSKDYEFEEEELVFLWMAEGLIPKQNGHKQIEDLGREYFKELLSRSLFQPASSGELFVMHDLINDLAQFLTRKVCFRLEDKPKESEGDESIIKARHSSYSRGYEDGVKRFEAFRKAKNLRTFLPLGSRGQVTSYLTSNVPFNLLPSLKRLRVLSLQGYGVGELSDSIGDLKHVRYLDLSHALVLMLPESIATLYNLQTLILRYCKNLKKLPANTSNLINLCHLNLTDTNSFQEMPSSIGKLTSLQTLSKFIVGNGNWSRITELGNLIHLGGRLSILGLENVRDALDARGANLKDKQGLNVLLLEWGNILDNSRDRSAESKVLDELEPHKKLKDLSIAGYGGLKFPTWVGNPLFTNMVCLKFKNCQNCTSLPPLGQLPSLAELYIEGMKAVCNVGLEFYGSRRPNPFPALEILSFVDMTEWEDWTPFVVEEGAQAFPCLSELSIRRCPKLLHELPRNLPRLRKLNITKCPALAVAWDRSPIELNEVRNKLQHDSINSLCLYDVLILDSFRSSSEVGDHALLKNSRRSLLTWLKVGNVRGHKCLPSWFFQGLTGLQKLDLDDCDELTTLWENDVRLQSSLPALRSLKIMMCPKLITLFAEGDDLNSLQNLYIWHCPSLASFPVLPSTLRNLLIYECDGLLSLPDLALLNNLENLDLHFCRSLTYLSSGRGLPPALKVLNIHGCPELKSLIAEDRMKINCPSLEAISIRSCKALKTLPDVLQSTGLSNLSGLDVSGCENLESLPEGWFPTTNLRKFDISRCEKLQPLPSDAYSNNNLASLEELELSSSPMGAGLLFHILDEGSSSYFINLTELGLSNLDISKLCGLRRLSSLRALQLSDCDWVSAPEDWMLSFPSSLIKLGIRGSKNLEKLGFGNLSLEQLSVGYCPQLMSITELPPLLLDLWIFDCAIIASFGDQGLPPSLLSLRISDCPILKQRCEKDKGPYWKFIAHIPQVHVDQ